MSLIGSVRTQAGLVVDAVLDVCADSRIELNIQGDRCHVRSLDGTWEDHIAWPLPKSALRAFIARVAALCVESTPNGVSPYGGEGEVTLAGKPGAVIQAAFINTTAHQSLKLSNLKTTVDAPDSHRILTEVGIATTIGGR